MNPFTKQNFNLTEQMKVTREDPSLADQLKVEALAIDAENDRKTRTRTLDEFNSLSTNQKLEFIKNNGEIVGNNC